MSEMCAADWHHMQLIDSLKSCVSVDGVNLFKVERHDCHRLRFIYDQIPCSFSHYGNQVPKVGDLIEISFPYFYDLLKRRYRCSVTEVRFDGLSHIYSCFHGGLSRV